MGWLFKHKRLYNQQFRTPPWGCRAHRAGPRAQIYFHPEHVCFHSRSYFLAFVILPSCLNKTGLYFPSPNKGQLCELHWSECIVRGIVHISKSVVRGNNQELQLPTNRQLLVLESLMGHGCVEKEARFKYTARMNQHTILPSSSWVRPLSGHIKPKKY